MSLTESYKRAARRGNITLFRTVNFRVAAALVRLQTEGFIDGFSSQNVQVGADNRHTSFAIKGFNFNARHANDSKPVNADFAINITSGKTGPVTLAFSPVGAKARNLLSRITGKDRLEEIKQSHSVTDTASNDFKLSLEIISGALSRAGKQFYESKHVLEQNLG